MSQPGEAYTLGVYGLSATQRMVVGSLCRLSQSRGIRYVLQDSPDARASDMVVVDTDDAEAFHRWQNQENAFNGPVVYVSAAPLSDLADKHYNILRSHLSGGLLQLLNRIVVNELGHKPPATANKTDGNQSGSREKGTFRGHPAARALVIDDSLSARTQISLCLEKLNMDVTVAKDAQHALNQLQDRFFDIIFLDVILPDMDGYQVCKLIKKDPMTRRVPVVMLTSKGSTINRLQGSIAGCDRYLVKPASEDDVISVAKHLLPAFQHAQSG